MILFLFRSLNSLLIPTSDFPGRFVPIILKEFHLSQAQAKRGNIQNNLASSDWRPGGWELASLWLRLGRDGHEKWAGLGHL
jgi:hypothetical protein